MQEDQSHSLEPADPRRLAEAQHQERASSADQSSSLAESQRLVRELQARQRELESRNEELWKILTGFEQEVRKARESENELRSILDHSLDAILLTAPDGRIFKANSAACRLFGRTEEEICRIGRDGLLDPADRRLAVALAERDRGGKARAELTCVRGDGTRFPGEINSAVFLDREGRPRTSLIVRDTTARKEEETALRLSEARYRAVIETSQDGFWIVDREGRLLEANETYAHLSGYSVDELRAMRVADLEADENPSEIAAHMEAAVQKGGDLFQTRHRAKSGRIWQAEVNVSYWPVGAGQFFVFIRDLRRRRSRTLLKARRRLSDIAHEGSLDELLQAALGVAERITGSQTGFFHFIGPDQEHLTLQAWSTNTLKNLCKVTGQSSHYPISQAGVWVECFHRRAPVIHNDYARLPDRKGLPEGHAPVIRELTVPVLRDGSVVAIVGVGNKPENYTDDDVATVRELASMVMDLVERKQIEQTLRYYECIVAATPDSLALLDRNYIYLAVNAEYSRRTGKPREAIVGHSVGEVLGEELFQTQLKGKLDRCLAGELVQFNRWFDFVAKGRRLLDVTYAPYRDEMGAVAGVVVNTRDITDLERVEERLRESEAKIKSIFRAAPIGLGLTVDRVIQEVNQTMCQLLGYTREELIGKNARPLYPSQADFDFVGTEKYRQIRERGVGTVETHWCRKDGTVLDILLSSTAIDPGDFSKGISFAAMDITERKRVEAHLVENTKRLQQLSRRLLSVQEEERRALARELHDDLGQQLAALKLNLAILQRTLTDAVHQSRIADCIRIADHTRQHIQNTARQLRPAVLDDLGLAAALHWYARSQAERAGCAIEVQDELPPLSPELETAVFRIAQEAVHNALRHGQARHITVTVVADHEELSLAIQDDGDGFDPNPSGTGPQTGLGLIGMRERAELLGGRFALASRPGAGTRVEVMIPLPEAAP